VEASGDVPAQRATDDGALADALGRAAAAEALWVVNTIHDAHERSLRRVSSNPPSRPAPFELKPEAAVSVKLRESWLLPVEGYRNRRKSTLETVGLGFSFVPISIAALAGAAGRGGSRFGAAQHLAADRRALGIAALSAIATSTTTSDLSSGTTPSFALTNGFQDAFIAGAIVAFVGVLVSIFVVSRRDLTEELPEVEPAFEQAA
jgi:hypothetical protein